MNLVPFLLYSALGTLLWTGALAYAGYLLGKNYRAVEKYLGPAAIVAIVALVVAFAVWVVKRKKHRSEKRRHQ
jgi:membrane protein DedA with SNARE-associated domain